MKKLLMSISLVTSLAAVSLASVTAPQNRDGSQLGTLDFVGAKACVVDSASTTVGKACMVGRGVVYGFVMEGDFAVNFAVLWDSAAVASPSSFTVITSTGGTDTVAGGNSLVMKKLPVPIQFTNGLFVKPNATISAGGMWTVLYRPLAATE